MSLIDQIIKGKRLTADFLYSLVYGLANGDLDTTNNNLTYFRSKSLKDHVMEGCVWAGDAYASTRYASMSAGVICIGGKVVSVNSVANRQFTASKDTYVDVDNNGVIYYTEVSNNAASPALTSGRMRIAIVVTGATTIAAAASINQGSLQATLPVVSSEYLRGCDTSGNPIYNTNPIELIFERTGTSSPAPTSEADVAGATMTFTLTKPAIATMDFWAHTQLNSGADRQAFWKLYLDGSAITQIYHRDNPGAPETHIDGYKPADVPLAAGTHTIKIRAAANTINTITIDGGVRIRIR